MRDQAMTALSRANYIKSRYIIILLGAGERRMAF